MENGEEVIERNDDGGDVVREKNMMKKMIYV